MSGLEITRSRYGSRHLNGRNAWVAVAATLALLLGFLALPVSAGAAAGPSPSDLEQCDPPAGADRATYDCATSGATGWSKGNNNGPFAEGDTVPYRLPFTNLVVGNEYRATIEWDTTKGGKHAIDYLKSYNATLQGADACVSLSKLPEGVCGSPPSTIAIPPDSVMQASADWVANAGVQDPGVFTMYGATLTGVGDYAAPASYAGDTSTSVSVYFTATSSTGILAWGGHIAERADWGKNNSAIDISGSPYHVNFASWWDVTNNAGLNGGAQDLSLSVSGVVIPASITVVKAATPEGATSFPFTASPAPLANFSLIDDGTAANTRTFSSIVDFGTYTITESVPAGWALSGITCTVANANGGARTVALPKVDIKLRQGEDVTCTFANTSTFVPAPAIDVEKAVLVGSDWVDADTPQARATIAAGQNQFRYTVSNSGNVPLRSVTLADDVFPTLPECSVPSPLAVGASYSCVVTRPIGNGNHLNTATARGTYGGTCVTDSDAVYAFGATATIDVEKSVRRAAESVWRDADDAPGVYVRSGDGTDFRFVITNTGNVPLAGVQLSDDDLALTSCPAVADPLPAGATYTCVVSGIVLPDGQHTNTATAAGGYGGATVSDSDSANASVVSLDVEKYVSVVDPDSAAFDPASDWLDADTAGAAPSADVGDEVWFRFVVTRAGDVPMPGVLLGDSVYGQGTGDVATRALPDPECAAVTLPSGMPAFECVISRTMTTADIGMHSSDAAVRATLVDTFGDQLVLEDSDPVFLAVAALPTLSVGKAASPASVPETGGDVTFTYLVTNTSDEPLTITGLHDDVLGDLAGDADCAVGTVLAPAGQAGDSCGFTVGTFLRGEPSAPHVNVFTATADDADGNSASDTASAIVRFDDVAPGVDLVKAVSTARLPAPGGQFVYTLTITNTSAESVTITALTDDVALPAACLDLVGTVLAPSQSVSCSYSVTHTAVGGYDNTASVTVQDDDGSTASDSDSVSVEVTAAPMAAGPPAPSTGALAATGAGVLAYIAGLGMLLILAGAVQAAAARRR